MKSRRNFCSTTETDTNLKVHELYINLGIDAALLIVNDRLPELSDEDNQTVIDAAQAAATAVLDLARVPNNWLDLLENLHYDRSEKVRSEMWEIVFDLLPAAEDAAGERMGRIQTKILACAKPGREETMRRAVNELSDFYMREVLETIQAAFQLGYELAHDPTKLILEKVGRV